MEEDNGLRDINEEGATISKKTQKSDLDINTPKGTISHKIIQLSSGISFKTDVKNKSRSLRQYSGHITKRSGKEYLHIENGKGKIIQDTELPTNFPKLNFIDNNDSYYAPSDVSSQSGTTAFAAIPKKISEQRNVNSLDDCGIKQEVTSDGSWRKYSNISGTSMVVYPIYLRQFGDGYDFDWERINKIHHERDHQSYIKSYPPNRAELEGEGSYRGETVTNEKEVIEKTRLKLKKENGGKGIIDLKEINTEIRPILQEYRRLFKIVPPIIFIGAGLTIAIIYTAEIGYIKTISGYLYIVILITNLILLHFEEKKMKKVLKIIEFEGETNKRIINEENYKLLPRVYKKKREKVNFTEE